jgi:membrane protease YdiL (CAAX protease family)
VVLVLSIWMATTGLAGIVAVVARVAQLSDSTRLLRPGDLAAELADSSGTMLAVAAGTALGTVLAVWLMRRFFDGPSLLDLGLRTGPGWLGQTVLGLALGPAMFLSVLLVLLAAGWATVAPGRVTAAGLMSALATYALVAFSEEVLARGWIFQTLERGRGTRVAVIGSSVVFAALHGFNPDFTVAALLGLVLAGLLLAQAYLVTRRLWLPLALHFSWNVGEGPLFGFPVSGLPADGLLSVTPTGPELVTGGAFGPEAGVVIVVGIALASGVLALYGRSRFRSLPGQAATPS